MSITDATGSGVGSGGTARTLRFRTGPLPGLVPELLLRCRAGHFAQLPHIHLVEVLRVEIVGGRGGAPSPSHRPTRTTQQAASNLPRWGRSSGAGPRTPAQLHGPNRMMTWSTHDASGAPMACGSGENLGREGVARHGFKASRRAGEWVCHLNAEHLFH